MTTLLRLSLVLLVGALLAGASLAGRAVTVEGKILCAKCSLQEEGRSECQNVLVVEKKNGGGEKQFYLTKNEVYEKFGEVCKDARQVRVTGEVTREEGRAWLAASEITPIEDKEQG